MKNMREISYILGIKIYWDRSRRLLELQSTYINKMLKWFIMEEPKREYLLFSYGIHLSKDVYPKKQIERDRIKKTPL